MPKEWEKEFPNLGKWTCTSKATGDYNCIAFAVGDQTRWWEPCPSYYWPPEDNPDYTAECLIRALEAEGFKRCKDGSLVDGCEKIVIYLNDSGGWEHAARQESNGYWRSKIGEAEDIEHESPESLTSGDYGKPRLFMERPRKKMETKKEAEVSIASASSDDKAPQVDVSNPSHREDFNSLLDAAVKKPAQED
jgi:hypothetical protein